MQKAQRVWTSQFYKVKENFLYCSKNRIGKTKFSIDYGKQNYIQFEFNAGVEDIYVWSIGGGGGGEGCLLHRIKLIVYKLHLLYTDDIQTVYVQNADFIMTLSAFSFKTKLKKKWKIG